MTPESFTDTYHEEMTGRVRAAILTHPDLVSVPITWSSGVILATRRH